MSLRSGEVAGVTQLRQPKGHQEPQAAVRVRYSSDSPIRSSSSTPVGRQRA
jgi:hypothetical protein